MLQFPPGRADSFSHYKIEETKKSSLMARVARDLLARYLLAVFSLRGDAITQTVTRHGLVQNLETNK